MPSVAAILGSAFHTLTGRLDLQAREIDTPYGTHVLHRVADAPQPAYVSFRHGLPHRLLPNQINYRAQAWALQAVDCGALLVTSSVGVMDAAVPIYQPLLVEDLIMLENRLPDGSTCTMFEQPDPSHGHLVLEDGLFSSTLNAQVQELAEDVGSPIAGTVVFAYVGGPRGKTAAENRLWPQLGAQVNSMTLAPEVVLANELEIPSAGLVVGHKYSVPEGDVPASQDAMSDTLDHSREAQEQIVRRFLEGAEAVPFGNQLYRFEAPVETDE